QPRADGDDRQATARHGSNPVGPELGFEQQVADDAILATWLGLYGVPLAHEVLSAWSSRVTWSRGGVSRHADERVPTLVEAIRETRGRAMLNLDVKDEAAIRPMVAVLRAADALADVVVTGCTEPWAARVHGLEPSLPVFLNMDTSLEAAARGGSDALATLGVRRALSAGLRGLNLHHSHVTEQLVAHAHARGVAVWTWTVDDPARIRELAQLGVDAISSNDPSALVGALGRSS
ncbi:MAG: glycerophosphodiester phosphodiesterase, partial [Candidatus Poribacteria bacterium]